MKNSMFIISLIAIGGFTSTACSEDNAINAGAITISTPQIQSVTSTSAVMSAEVDGNLRYLVKKGVCYATGGTPTVDSLSTDFDRNAAQATVTGLQPGKTYKVRAYALFQDTEPRYSEEVTFSTGTQTLEEALANYTAPTYADNYVSFASWDQRSQWNLANVHDPSVVKGDDGYYYMYQTDASYGNAHSGHGHFHCRRSKDLVNWEYLGATMQSLPSWVKPKLNEVRKAMGLGESTIDFNDDTQFGYWAPCVRKVNDGLYRMYYAITCPGTIDGDGTWSERCFIGMMENTSPANNAGWVDKGYVLTNASDKGLDFHVNATDYANCYFKWNAIDPSYIITPGGEHWLVYGSWHSGIAAVRLNPDTGMPQTALGNPWGDISAYGKLIATRKAGDRWQASEAPEVVYHDGWYYLFLAYDALDKPYNTRVVRSRTIDGPYYGMDGRNVTEGGDAYPVVTHPYKFAEGDGWVGISHCAVFDDGDGNWFFSSQGRFPANVGGNPYSNAIMMGQVRSMRWTDDGWPVVMPERYGAVPQAEIKESELVGEWEHITISYGYGKQRGSVSMTLGDDHKVTDGWNKGQTWSYDAGNKVLTIAGIKMYLQREVDWEATPRVLTIVYSGYNDYKTANSMKTYWGKKK